MKKCQKLAAFVAFLAITLALVGTGCPTETTGGETFNITPYTGTDGNITASHVKAAAGVTVTLTIKPNPGYELSTIRVTREDGLIPAVVLTGSGTTDGSTREFTMPASNVSIYGTFKKLDTYTIKLTFNAAGGTATYSSNPPKESYDGNETYDGGEIITVTTANNLGYNPGVITVTPIGSSESLSGQSSFTFTMPKESVAINVNFTAILYDINVENDKLKKPLASKTATVGTPIILELDIPTKVDTGGTGEYKTTVAVTRTGGTVDFQRQGVIVSFTMPAADVTVDITYTEYTVAELDALDKYEIVKDTYKGGDVDIYKSNGTTEITDLTDIYEGQVVVLKLSTTPGFIYKSLTIEKDDGTEVVYGVLPPEPGEKTLIFSFDMPASDVTISAEWLPIEATVNLIFDGFTKQMFDFDGGVIDDKVTLRWGESLYVTLVNPPTSFSGCTWFIDDDEVKTTGQDPITGIEGNFSYEQAIGWLPQLPADMGKHTLTVIIYVDGVPYSKTLSIEVIW